MTVYDYRYKAWEGQRRGPLWRWLAIPHFAYMDLFKTRLLTAALMLSAAFLVGGATIIYLYVNAPILKMLKIPMQALPPINGVFFKAMIDLQLPTCFLLAFMAGSGLIARDLKHNAVVLYACKPIHRWEYLLGKFSVLFFIDATLLCVGPLALFVLQVAVSPDYKPWSQNFWHDYAGIAPSIVLYGLSCAVTLSLLIMAASSLTENARYAGAAFAAFLIGAEVFTAMLAGVTGDQWLLAFSPFNAVTGVGIYLFHAGAEPANVPFSQVLAWASIVAYWGLALFILNWRVAGRASHGR
jgi:ABC-type transport system involved in multi-copper enzyme maturation permease subunit